MKGGGLLKNTTAIIFPRRALSMNLVVEEIYAVYAHVVSIPADYL
jgi:hypothetical protein